MRSKDMTLEIARIILQLEEASFNYDAEMKEGDLAGALARIECRFRGLDLQSESFLALMVAPLHLLYDSAVAKYNILAKNVQEELKQRGVPTQFDYT